jgi:hypothetical protein
VAGRASGFLDGRWTKARFTLPSGLIVGTQGNLIVAESYNNCLRGISPDGWVTTVAGPGGLYLYGPDGQGKSATFDNPHGPALDQAGNLYVMDTEGMNRVRRITPDGRATTLAGANASGQADGPGAAARFHNARGIAVDSTGTLYVTDFDSHTIRKGVPFAVAALLPNREVTCGDELELRVEPTGTGVFSFEWTHNDKPLFVESAGRLYLRSTTRADSGRYAVVIRNAGGSWLRFETIVRVKVPPVLAPPEILEIGSIRLRFRGSDGGIPDDLAGLTLQWRSTLPSGADTNWTAVPAGLSIVEDWVVFDDLDAKPWPAGFYRIQAPWSPDLPGSGTVQNPRRDSGRPIAPVR